ncbi:MAG: type II secretion system protein [Patescibacteria group bacterium]
MGIKAKRGFTLIEMVIVVGVLGFALPVFFSIVFLVIRQQVRFYSLQEIKKQGDNALYSMKSSMKQYGETVVNPSVYPTSLFPTIIDICPVYPAATLTPAPFIHMFDKERFAFSYSLDDNKIASNSPRNNIVNLYLTNDDVAISDLGFTCYRTNQFSPPIIWTSFVITKTGSGTDLPSIRYNTKFQLRSY